MFFCKVNEVGNFLSKVMIKKSVEYMYNEGDLLKVLVEFLLYLFENICMCIVD